MSLVEINNRYSLLAEDTCCLSCGGAVDHSKAAKGEVCVDLGSGRGTDVIRLAGEVGEEGFAYGIDISDGMLEKARKTAEKTGIKNVRFIRSELEELQLESNLADLVISNCTINHARDKQQVWNEIYRILKEGGRFVVSDIYSLEPVPEEYHNDPVAISECWAGAVTRDEYMSTLQNAGFKNISVIEESAPYPKGKINVSSFTISGYKKAKKCCCCD
jgi:arsenite methyltransferase